MFYYVDPSTNTRHYEGQAFTYGDLQYSPSAANEALFISLGFTKVTIQPKPDTRFYNVTGPDANGNWTSTPKDLSELKAKFVGQIKAAAHNELGNTDWYIIRRSEIGTAIPPVVVEYRNNVRALQASHCASIMNAADLTTLQTTVGLAYIPNWGEPLSQEHYHGGYY